MMKIIEEFKEFALKGNVIDLAVGVVIGASFNNIVNSLVNDIITPPIGFLIGGVDFKALSLKLITEVAGKESIVEIKYGAFLNNILQFLIVAVTIFFVVKVMNKLMTFRIGKIAAPATKDSVTRTES
jgi:large conductance mechanosensitive channel